MEELFRLAEERAEIIDKIISDITSDLRIDCGEGCVYCCYGVPLWIRLVEAYHILHALNKLPIKERKEIASRLRVYRKEYEISAEREGYRPESPTYEERLDVERLGLVCGLGMNEIPCPFLSEEGRCKVYKARPSMCRLTLFSDRNVCRRDWENPLSFIWSREIAPFIEEVKGRFQKRWSAELKRLQEKYPDLDILRLEKEMIFLPYHLSLDPLKKTFKLKVSYSP